MNSFLERRLQIPPEALDVPKAVEKAANALRKITADRDQERERVAALDGERQAAETADRDALVAALRAGKPEPGPEAVTKLDADLVAAKRRLGALEIAVADAGSELTVEVEKAGSAWYAALDDRAAANRKRYAEAIDQLEQARSALSASYATASWLRSYPNGKATFAAYAGASTALRDTSGEQRSFGDLVAALRVDAEAPKLPPSPDDAPKSSLRPAGLMIGGAFFQAGYEPPERVEEPAAV